MKITNATTFNTSNSVLTSIACFTHTTCLLTGDSEQLVLSTSSNGLPLLVLVPRDHLKDCYYLTRTISLVN